MTTENWIAIGGLLTAFFSAIAAAFAVIQSKLQRTTLTKPQLIVASIDIPVINKSDGFFSTSPKEEESIHHLKVPIKNVGLGTALNLKYSWDFDYLKALKDCRFSHTDIHQMETLRSAKRPDEINKTFYYENNKKDDFFYFSLFNKNTFKSYSLKKVATDLEYIIPITQDDSPKSLLLPLLIPILIIEQLENTVTLTDRMLTEFDGGVLNLQYEDISGQKFYVKFSCKFKLVRFKSNGEHGPESVYNLKLHRLKKASW